MKGVIFDLDGTLTLTQHLHQRAFAEVFKQFGINYDQHLDFYYAGMGSKNTFPAVFKKFGVTDYNVDECYQEKKRIYQELLQSEPINPTPGVKNFIEKLKSRNIPFIVASGNRREFVNFVLQESGLRDLFPEVVTNHDVKNGKPAPDVFLYAAQKINTEPKYCVVFEDAWSGIKAAKAAGMYCVGLASKVLQEELLEVGANMAIQDFTDKRLDTLF